MRALIVDQEAPGRLRLGNAPEPEPKANQVLAMTTALMIGPQSI